MGYDDNALFRRYGVRLGCKGRLALPNWFYGKPTLVIGDKPVPVALTILTGLLMLLNKKMLKLALPNGVHLAVTSPTLLRRSPG